MATRAQVMKVIRHMGGGPVQLDFRRLRPESARIGFALTMEDGTIIDGIGVRPQQGDLVWIPENGEAQEGQSPDKPIKP